LGNVLSVVSDKKEFVFDHWESYVLSAQDYYPFGMSMPSRKHNGGSYRYGFNGKETDSETGIQDYGMRWYLPNIGRFGSVDPLTGAYPQLTPYQFAGNAPIQAVDLDGGEPLSCEESTKTMGVGHSKFGYNVIHMSDPALGEGMFTIMFYPNTSRYYVFKKHGNSSTTGGDIYDDDEFKKKGAWSGFWQEYKTPDRTREENRQQAANITEKTLAVIGVGVGAAVAAPFIIGGAAAAAPLVSQGISATAEATWLAARVTARVGLWVGRTAMANAAKPANIGSAVADVYQQSIFLVAQGRPLTELNLLSTASQWFMGGRLSAFTSSFVANSGTISIDKVEFNWSMTDSKKNWTTAQNIGIGTVTNLMGAASTVNGAGYSGVLFTSLLGNSAANFLGAAAQYARDNPNGSGQANPPKQ
jgi:RHS repeat-associated protein